MDEIMIDVVLDEGAHMPVKAHRSDTGYDLRVLSATESERTYKNVDGDDIPCIVKVVTGVHIQPGAKAWTMLAANSRICDLPFVLGNGVGIIDKGYTGSVNLKFKVLPWATREDIDKFFAPGNVVGQLCVMPFVDSEMRSSEEISCTDRGEGGFGSTDPQFVNIL